MSEHDEDAVVERLVRAYFDAEPYTDEEWERERANSRGLDAVCHSVQRILSAIKPGDRLSGGLRVVPEEPSELMLGVGGALHEAWDESATDERMDNAGEIYRAMIAASGD